MTDTIDQPIIFEPTTRIKPSEALRLGRLVRPMQATGQSFEGKFGACALGAIAIGYGWPGASGWPDDSENVYDFVSQHSGLPLVPEKGVPVSVEHIWKTNDDARFNWGEGPDAAVLALLEEHGL